MPEPLFSDNQKPPPGRDSHRPTKGKTMKNEQIANDFNLWQEYADPSGTMTREEWDGMTIEDRIKLLEACGFEDDD